MRHVIDKVVLYLRQAFLPENRVNRKDKDDEQYQRKDDSRNHELHRSKQILLHFGEVNVKQTGLCQRVVRVKFLTISILLTFRLIVSTSIHLASVRSRYIKVIVDVDTVASQLSSQVTIEFSKVDALCQGFVARLI